MAKVNSLKTHTLGLIIGLSLEYILGMTTNLYVHFPEGVKEGAAWEFAWSQIPLAAHIILGLLLVVGASALVVKAIKAKDKNWIRTSVIGFLAILTSGLGG